MTVKELENKITEYAQKYYSGVAEISDDAFDALCDELRALNPDSEVLKKTGWGFNPTGEKKVNHLYNLTVGSLSKIKAGEVIPENFKKESTRISAKLDGLSVVCYYKNGSRFLALTRGNGKTGVDVTKKMDVISPESKNLPIPFTGAIRGEVLISNETWERIKDTYGSEYANQRNLAAGILNRNEVTKETEYLDYVVYKIIADDMPRETKTSWITNLLETFGFKVVPYVKGISFDESFLRETLDKFLETYPCDGLVFTEDEVSHVGSVINYSEVAFKFQAESKIVEVKDVIYNLTRTGRAVPLVWFDPVELSGAMVQKCTGFNAQYIKDNKINIGSKIRVCRSGEVIPYILEVVEPSEEGYIPKMIDGYNLEWKGTDLVVENYEGQVGYHFIETLTPLDNVGPALYSTICDYERISDFASLESFLTRLALNYNSVETEMVNQVNGSVTKENVKKIYSTLASPVEPAGFLVAMSIPGVSWTLSETIVNKYPDILERIKDGTFNTNDLYNIDGVGSATVSAFEKRLPTIKRILDVIKIKETVKEVKAEAKFKVAITGALSMKRSDFVKRLNEIGVYESGSFKEIKYLITNTPYSGSSKNQKARQFGVEVISEDEFTRKYF